MVLRPYVVVIVLSGFAIAGCERTVKTMSQPQSSQATSLATNEPYGGQPPKGSQPTANLDGDTIHDRVFQTVLWSLPAVAIYRFRAAAFQDLGLKDNDIIAYSVPATPRLEALTANSTTPYITAFTDLKRGPAVLEIPPSGSDGSLYGQVVDAWQLTIADVGPSGLDKGKGGKYLFTPLGYEGKIPAGYIHVASPNYRIAFAFRSIPAPGKTPSDAYAYSKRLKMYYLSEAAHPPEQKFVDPYNQRYATLPIYDERYFNDVNDIFTYEPIREQDKLQVGVLTSLGIDRGKPFTPSDPQKQQMRQGAIDAWFYLQDKLDHLPNDKLFWSDRHYVPLLLTDRNQMFTYDYENSIDLDARALQYFWCTYVPKKLEEKPATYYVVAMADSTGAPMKAGETYKLVVPAKMPVKQFWALTVYDHATFSFIYTESNRTTLSSFDIDKMKKNDDGSVTLYIGPSAPTGFEANWIPTGGKRPMPTMRLYGATDDFYNRTFKLNDFEHVAR